MGRLGHPPVETPHAERVAAHMARPLAGSVLVSTPQGEWLTLSPEDYRRYLKGGVSNEEPLGVELRTKGFFRDYQDFRAEAERAVSRGLLAAKGPGVHVLVLTRRCNYKCVYCHASVGGPDAPGLDMSPETAMKAVDLVFESPAPELMLEFQGGEPLLNWPVLKLIVRYAKEKNRLHKRTLRFGLVSNLTLLDDEKAGWLIAEGVSFCTSLDGPAHIHDKNRLALGGAGHADTMRSLALLKARREAGAAFDAPNAICTVSRWSLPHAEAIVDFLVAQGLERVQLGPLDPIGFARRAWDSVGYTTEEWLSFYGRALDHIIALNLKGVKAYEKTALILLVRMLGTGQWRFPNGEGLHRLAYNHDGAVYASEEGRLLANEGDPFFKVGEVGRTSFAEILEHPTVRACWLAASPLAQPMCSQCAYSPFCTVLPVHNYQTQGSLWGHMPTNHWCGKMMGLFDLLFERLKDPGKRRVLESWLGWKDR